MLQMRPHQKVTYGGHSRVNISRAIILYIIHSCLANVKIYISGPAEL